MRLSELRLRKTAVQWYLWSASGILLLLSSAKWISAFGTARLLTVNDPILPVFSVKSVVIIAASLELVVGVFVLSSFGLEKRLASLVMLGFAFAGYRISLLVFGVGDPCPCLGSLTEWLHLSNRAASGLSLLALTYLLVPSLFYLMRHDA